jgi:competence protein ComEC
MEKRRKLQLYVLGLLSGSTFFLWMYLSSFSFTNKMHVAFLDIGQGDSIYIRAPNGRQMLIDGGPKGALMRPLEREVLYGNKFIDVVMITNADADHYAGYLDLLQKYDVGVVVEAGVRSKTKTYLAFEALVAHKHIPEVIARKGMQIILDEPRGVSYTVLFPDRNVSDWSTNDASVMGRLVYGNNSIMFTGDAPSTTEALLIADNTPEDLKSDILKVGHHGSRTSTSNAFLEVVKPLYAVISAGKNNRYGHPTPETLDRLNQHHIPTFVTKDVGTVVFETDGKLLQQIK